MQIRAEPRTPPYIKQDVPSVASAAAEAVLHSREGAVPAIARAYVEHQALTVRHNHAVQAAVDRADPEVSAEIRDVVAGAGVTFSLALALRLVELSLERAERKSTGVVFTPAHIVAYICQRTLDIHTGPSAVVGAEPLAILDPAAGAGAFLVGMAEALRQRSGERPHSVIARHLYAADVCAESLAAAEVMLGLWAVQHGDDVADTGLKSRIGDSLDGCSLSDEFAVRGGFSAVVGNPPYVRIQNLPQETRAALRRSWPTARTGNTDLYIPFVELALRELGPEGAAGYILPRSFTTTQAGTGLRSLLGERQSVVEIYDFAHHQVFDDVTTYSCMLFVSRRHNDSFRYVAANSSQRIPDVARAGTINSSRLGALHGSLFSRMLDPSSNALQVSEPHWVRVRGSEPGSPRSQIPSI